MKPEWTIQVRLFLETFRMQIHLHHQLAQANLLLIYKKQKDKTPYVFLSIKFPCQASSGFAFLNTLRLRAAC